MEIDIYLTTGQVAPLAFSEGFFNCLLPSLGEPWAIFNKYKMADLLALCQSAFDIAGPPIGNMILGSPPFKSVINQEKNFGLVFCQDLLHSEVDHFALYIGLDDVLSKVSDDTTLQVFTPPTVDIDQFCFPAQRVTNVTRDFLVNPAGPVIGFWEGYTPCMTALKIKDVFQRHKPSKVIINDSIPAQGSAEFTPSSAGLLARMSCLYGIPYEIVLSKKNDQTLAQGAAKESYFAANGMIRLYQTSDLIVSFVDQTYIPPIFASQQSLGIEYV